MCSVEHWACRSAAAVGISPVISPHFTVTTICPLAVSTSPAAVACKRRLQPLQHLATLCDCIIVVFLSLSRCSEKMREAPRKVAVLVRLNQVTEECRQWPWPDLQVLQSQTSTKCSRRGVLRNMWNVTLGQGTTSTWSDVWLSRTGSPSGFEGLKVSWTGTAILPANRCKTSATEVQNPTVLAVFEVQRTEVKNSNQM